MSTHLYDDSQSKTGEEHQAQSRVEQNSGDSDNLVPRITSGLLCLAIITVCGEMIIRYMQGRAISAGLTAIGMTAIGLLFGFSHLLKSKK